MNTLYIYMSNLNASSSNNMLPIHKPQAEKIGPIIEDL